jgi:gas vesicle protein
MSDNKENNKTEPEHNHKVLGALLLGAAIGAGLGYLFASEEGKELRKKVVDKVKDFVDNIKEKVEDNTTGNS